MLPQRHSPFGATFHHPVLFVLGTLAIIAGVLSHVPMFLHSATMGYRMVGMPMDSLMIAGMFAIVGGLACAFWGLTPPRAERSTVKAQGLAVKFRAIDDAALSREHWKLVTTLTVAIIIDVMKPATLGFVMPGMKLEYGLSQYIVVLFPLSALTGTAVGSVAWGLLGDKIGRRATILLSALMFMGTAICGAMPTFEWNLGMCFLMGMSAGGLLPTTFTLIAETIPARHRGWMMVLVGAVGTTGGFLAASGAAALLEPNYGWRVLWLLGLPTGLILIVLNRFIPESPRYLILHAHASEARHLLERYGVRLEIATVATEKDEENGADDAWYEAPVSWRHLFRRPYGGLTFGLTLCGGAWGLVNFGFLMWLPSNLRELGMSAAVSNTILAKGALIAFPGALVVTFLYHSWSSKKTLLLFVTLTVLALLGFAAIGASVSQGQWLLMLLTVILLVASGGVIAILLPYSAEIYPLRVRATGAGIVAGSSKLGGVLGVGFGVPAVVSGVAASALVAAVPLVLAVVILGIRAVETRGHRLEDISLARLRPSHAPSE
ncbi:MAG: MFS transporter [Sulfuricaulis sp.]